MSSITIEQVGKCFGNTQALKNVSLAIESGEMFFLLGPSGCGKTTLLRILAGLVQPDEGEVYFANQRVTHLPSRQRDAVMVFQSYALWPHMTVAKNVAYGLRVRGLPKADIERRVRKALELVRLQDFADRRPAQLSGGQQQRVALARALVVEPRVVLLDEPLSNLDARLRDEMREEIRRLHAASGLTMVYVTHDQKEALTLADRIAVMKEGAIEQVGAPIEVFHKPVSQFVASFLGECNFLPGTIQSLDSSSATVMTAIGPFQASCRNPDLEVGAPVVCCLRPQSLTIGEKQGRPNEVSVVVKRLTFLGEVMRIEATAGETSLLITSLPYAATHLKPGDEVVLHVAAEHVAVLDR
ncbi:MAG: polyamine ABC transporter ATP-binding protein [Gemmatales bacterium]|nr:MAG: polyamine ABC transporter ATP-binding protein [Gemmatales bacterium]